MEKLVELSEHEIRIDFVLASKCRTTIHLHSLAAASPVAFKLQTSSPDKFLVNPPSGLAPPLGSTAFQVVLKPQSQIPPTFPRSSPDRFLLKTALAPELAHESPESIGPESVNSWFNSVPHRRTYDVKLKVYFIGAFLLKQAVHNGDVEAVRGIIRRQKSVVSELETREAESLYRATTQSDNPDMVDLLLDAGLRVVEDGGRWAAKGWSDLHVAAAFDRTEEVKRLVRVEERGSLDCRDKEGRTPLHLAASRGFLGIAKVLTGAGVNVDARSKDGRTALYRAAANGDCPMVEILLHAGADPTIADVDLGRSAIDIARDKGHKECVKVLERGESVLHAARRGDLNLLESLLEKGAITNFPDQYGMTALHIAAIKGYNRAIMMLAEFGADLECQDSEGHTPLHLAIEGGNIETVEVLINRGANLNARSVRGATPLDISKMMECEDLTQLLLDNGAIESAPSIVSSG